MLIVE
ncbi:hypothetical protein EC902281_0632, partial [Escherichia coli 90.2281]